MAKFKFKLSDLNEFWEIERHDCVLGGYTYHGKRVFVVCAHSKADCLESMDEFKKRSCE